MNSKQWLVLQDDVLNQDPGVIQEDLSSPQLYVQINQGQCTACGTLHQVGECPVASSVCFKCNKQSHFQGYVNLPQVHPVPIGIQGSYDAAEVEAATEVVKAVDLNVLYMKLTHLILRNL